MRRKRLKRRKRTRSTSPDNYRTDGSDPRAESRWFNQWQSLGSPTNPQGIPWGLDGISADPDATIARWIHTHCKFAKKSCARLNQGYDDVGGGESNAGSTVEG